MPDQLDAVANQMRVQETHEHTQDLTWRNRFTSYGCAQPQEYCVAEMFNYCCGEMLNLSSTSEPLMLFIWMKYTQT